MAYARAMAPVDARKAVPSYEFWTQEVHKKAESYISYQNSTPSNTPSTNSQDSTPRSTNLVNASRAASRYVGSYDPNTRTRCGMYGSTNSTVSSTKSDITSSG